MSEILHFFFLSDREKAHGTERFALKTEAKLFNF